MKAIFETTTLDNAIVEVLVIAYDTQLRQPIYFSRDKARDEPKDNLAFETAAMATSAAPTYFPSFRIGQDLYIDGGVVANNPACVAYAHSKKLWPTEDVLLLSIGTGSIASPLSDLRTTEWGLFQWARPVIDCLMDGTSQATDDFFQGAHVKNYLRLQGQLSEFTEGLDVTSPKALDELRAVAKAVIKTSNGAINNFLARLIDVGSPLGMTITSPTGGLVPLGPLRVEGEVHNYRGEDIYAFTGKLDRFWLSARVIPVYGRWAANLNVGQSAKTTTITLAHVDHNLMHYIEFYRKHAAALNHPGIAIKSISGRLATVEVVLDHKV